MGNELQRRHFGFDQIVNDALDQGYKFGHPVVEQAARLGHVIEIKLRETTSGRQIFSITRNISGSRVLGEEKLR